MLGNLGIVCLELGQPERARQHTENALTILRRVGQQRNEGYVLMSLMGLERLVAADWTRADSLGQQGEALLTQVGDGFGLGMLLCKRGHLELWAGRRAEAWLTRAQALAAAVGAGPDSLLGLSLTELRRACEAFEAGEHHRLFRGQLVEDLPEGLRCWLHETGQLPPDPLSASVLEDPSLNAARGRILSTGP